MRPISLDQIQEITDATRGPRTPCLPGPRRRLIPVQIGYCVQPPCFGPSAAAVPSGWRSCEPAKSVVEARPCEPPPEVDQESVETVAQGVAQGLRSAPSIVVRPAPWVEPDYRGVRFPQTATVVLTTLAAASVQVTAVAAALRGPFSGATVGTAVATAGSPVAVLTFQATDSYRADELVVACQDQEVLYGVQWTVTVNGDLRAGPFSVIGGRAPLALNARRGDSVAVNAILPSGATLCVGVLVLVNGWQYPALNQVDGTYTKSLRTSPSWPRRN